MAWLWSNDCLGLRVACSHLQVDEISESQGECSICTRQNSKLCIWSRIKSLLLNSMETRASETIWCRSMRHNSALQAEVLVSSRAWCWASYCLNTHTLRIALCVIHAIFVILFNSCRFTMTSWYLWSRIFTGATLSPLSLNSCFIAVK